MTAALRRAAHRLSPALWATEVLCLDLDAWQQHLLLTPGGAQVVVLSARQAGKTTAAAAAVAHEMAFRPGSLSVFAAPSQRQSAEAVRRVRAFLGVAGVRLAASNVFALETEAGARVIALPGSDDSVRGLSVDAVVVADEAARLSAELLAALRPMRARHVATSRLMMLSTAWTTTDPFWTVWAGDDPGWIRIRATAETISRYPEEFLRAEERALGTRAFRREYLGEPLGGDAAAFDPAAIAQLFARMPAELPATPPPAPADHVIHRAPAFGRLAV